MEGEEIIKAEWLTMVMFALKGSPHHPPPFHNIDFKSYISANNNTAFSNWPLFCLRTKEAELFLEKSVLSY